MMFEDVKIVGVPTIDAVGIPVLGISIAVPLCGCRYCDEEFIERLKFIAEHLSKELFVAGIAVVVP